MHFKWYLHSTTAYDRNLGISCNVFIFFLFLLRLGGIKTGFLYVTALTPLCRHPGSNLQRLVWLCLPSAESKGATPPCAQFLPFDLAFSSAQPTTNEYKNYHTSDVLWFSQSWVPGIILTKTQLSCLLPLVTSFWNLVCCQHNLYF